MSDASERYYRGSGAVPLKGTLLMLLGGLAVVVPATLVYSWGEMNVSHQKLKALIAIVFAMLIGGAVQGLARVGAVRSRLFAGLTGAVIGAMTVYFAWLWFLVILYQWDFGILMADPAEVVDIIKQNVNQGRWQRNNNPISPTEMGFIFAVEALLLIGFPTLMATRNRDPYCEACGKWTKTSPPLALPSTDSAGLKRDLEDENYEPLLRLPQQPMTEGSGTTVQLFCCPDCEDSNYLTLSTVTVTQKKKDVNVVTTPFMTYLSVPKEIADWVRRQGGADPGLVAETPTEAG